jgi:hypothetical protein
MNTSTGDVGGGVGASHQTGWSGLVSVLMESHAEPPTLAAGPPTAMPDHTPLGFRPHDAPSAPREGVLVP